MTVRDALPSSRYRYWAISVSSVKCELRLVGDTMQDVKFQWTRQRREVARLLTEEMMTPKQVMAETGMSYQQLWKLRNNPIFADYVNQLQNEFTKQAMNKGIASKIRRLSEQTDRWDRMQQVITERATDPTLANEPGGKTGLMVRDVKISGPYSIDVFSVDTGLLHEMRELEKLVGQETGDLDLRSTTDIRTLVINMAQMNGLTEEETQEAIRDAMSLLGSGR